MENFLRFAHGPLVPAIMATRPYYEDLQDYYGLRFHSHLGTGSFGMVIGTSDPGKVFKISVDPTEGPVWQSLIDSGLNESLEGIATCYSLHRLPEILSWYGEQLAVWVILRETILPRAIIHSERIPRPGMPRLKWAEMEEWWESLEGKEETKAERALENYSSAAYRFIESKLHEGEDELFQATEEMFQFGQTAGIAEAASKMLRETGVILADVHYNNYGYRTVDDPHSKKKASDVQWVVFDPGHSSLNITPSVSVFTRGMKSAASRIATFGED